MFDKLWNDLMWLLPDLSGKETFEVVRDFLSLGVAALGTYLAWRAIRMGRDQKRLGEEQRDLSKDQKQLAQDQKAIAERQEKLDIEQGKIAKRQGEIAEKQFEISQRQERLRPQLEIRSEVLPRPNGERLVNLRLVKFRLCRRARGAMGNRARHRPVHRRHERR